MTVTVIDEKALQADVDEARTKITDTKALYKWVCALLFFRYGVTPTTNRLYQLVRKGSMGTVTTALSTFWQDLRDKSRIQIDHPGVPDSLKSNAGELIQVLWEKANVEAKAQFDTAVLEAQGKADAAEAAAGEAHKIIESQRGEIAILGQRIEAIAAEKAALANALEDVRRGHSATTASLSAARTEAASLRQDLADSRRDFASELEKAREAVRLAEERLQAAERRALMEIDRERTARAEAESLVQECRCELAKNQQAANSRIQTLAGEIGELTGRLKAAEVAQARADQEVTKLRAAASDWESKAARAEGSLDAMKDRLAELQTDLGRDPIERARDASLAALQTFSKIAEAWKLSDAEQHALLGTTDRAQLDALAAGDQLIAPQSFSRIQKLWEIDRLLAVSNPKGRGDWLRKVNGMKAFKGQSPLDVILKGQPAEVRDFLVAANSKDAIPQRS